MYLMYKSILLVYILAAILLYGCGSQHETIESVPTRSPQEEMDVQTKIIETHIKNSSDSIFVLTIHTIPYSGYFQIILLKKNNSLESWIEFPNHAKKDSISGILEATERDFIFGELNAIRPTWKDNTQGSYSLIISINQSPKRVVSCNEHNCPGEICSIYQILKDVAKRQYTDLNIKISCPLENR